MFRRKNFTKAIIVARFKHCGGKCEICGLILKPGNYECDHHNPDGLTGLPTFENAQIICTGCHKEKTANDVTTIAKAKRREATHVGVRAIPHVVIHSRGFTSTAKRPPKQPLPPRALYQNRGSS